MTPRSRIAQRPGTFAVVGTCLALFASACSSSEAPDAAASTTVPESDVALATDSPRTRIQDVWVYERISTVELDGEIVDLTPQILATAEDLDDAVTLIDDVEFLEWPALEAEIVDGDGSARHDVEAVGGIVRDADGEAIMVLAVPVDDDALPIDDDDEVRIDLTAIEDVLAPGDPLVYEYTFAVSYGPDESGAPATGLDLFRHRAEAGRMEYVAEPVSGDVAVITEIGQAYEGSVTGGTPAKAKPMLDGFVEGMADCGKKSGLGCIGKYFEKFGGGSAESLGSIADEQLCIDDCKEPATQPGPDSGPGRADDGAGDGDAGDEDAGSNDRVDAGDGGTGEGFSPSDAVGGAECVANCPGESQRCWLQCFANALHTLIFGDPHLRTLDGRSYNLQSVGDFVYAESDGWTTHVRLVPVGDDGLVSAVGAVATRFNDDVITFDVDAEPGEQVLLDGEPLDLVPNGPSVSVGALRARQWRGLTQIAVEDVGMVSVDFAAGHLDVELLSVDETRRFEGLVGDGDGDPANDLRIGPDGAVVPDQNELEVIHTDYANAWRVSDETSLLPYEDDESTETFTDLDYREPAEDVVADSLRRKQAETLCTIMGITEDADLESCITDYVLTGDTTWIQGAFRSTRLRAMLENEPVYADGAPTAAEGETAWTAVISDITRPLPLLTVDGTVVVTGVRTRDAGGGGELIGLDATSGEELWRTAGVESACSSTIAAGRVVAVAAKGGPLAGPDDASALVAIDPTSGDTVDGLRYDPGPDGVVLANCDSLATVGSIVVHNQGDLLRGFAASDLQLLWTLELDASARPTPVPALGDDAGFWVGHRDGENVVLDLVDVSTGEVIASADKAGTPVTAAAPTPDGGILTWIVGDDDASLIRIGPDGTLSVVLERDTPSRSLAVEGGLLYAFLGDPFVRAVSLDDGSIEWESEGSSFQNNGGVVHVVDGRAIVGTFGGNYLEAHDADGIRWSIDVDDVLDDEENPGPVVQIGPVVDEHVLAVSTAGSYTVVVAVGT